jgi:hypothetical protein
MPSSYTPSLRLVLPVQGELSGAWGDTINQGITTLVDAAIAGTTAITMTDVDYTLSVANEDNDEARRMFLVLGGTLTATRNVICPAVSKLYIVHNNTNHPVTLKTPSGTGVAVPSGAKQALYCDGTNVIPGIDGNVSTSGTQTLTNKTIAFADNTLTGVASTSTSQTLTNKTFGNYTESVFSITDGSTVDLDPNNGPIQTWVLGGNRTPGQANWSAGQSITLMVDDGSSFAITWSTLNVEWKTEGGVAPVLNSTGFTVIALWKVGATIYGARVGNA